MTKPLQTLNDTQLIQRGSTRNHRHTLEPLIKIAIMQRRQFTTGEDNPMVMIQQTSLPTNSACRDRMIAGNHYYTHTCLVAASHRLRHIFPEWVTDPYES